MEKTELFTVVELMNVCRREIKISILPAPGSASASDPVVAVWRNEEVERRVIADSVSARQARLAADSHRRALEGTRWRIS